MSRALEGKVVLVTGAGSGIGRASAHRIAAAGAHVVISDINAEQGQAVLAEIAAEGGQASFLRADVGVEGDVAALIAAIVARHGRIDGAFNNAGIVQTGKRLHEVTTEEWDRAIRVDLSGVFWCIKYQVLAMLETGGGRIVNTASSLGEVAIANASEYVAAKHGVMGLTRAAAADYGAEGIRVNAILPGIIQTPVIDALAQNPDFKAFLVKLRDRHPIGRFGQPGEIGDAAVWLLSDQSSFVNGAGIPVDGGYLAI
ncbi:SDR family NAD(P)-dependent oxidoreductase [Novosphingobium sp. MD-1]|uniref:SDR family NAD(P)-dependent oxidoreductase n=1 Tax=Novosphingobium sp. MD-1 TaxID=1630648 RepID=UPI00061C8A8E|nr:SDR family oxidoreductase [Novosphingobium sp. MD-1]GAO56624.1 3-oxoacyl-[acyl-carrier protein] reductase [Novosphingobium sp. MD-1]